jgi:hypothetical protein
MRAQEEKSLRMQSNASADRSLTLPRMSDKHEYRSGALKKLRFLASIC